MRAHVCSFVGEVVEDADPSALGLKCDRSGCRKQAAHVLKFVWGFAYVCPAHLREEYDPITITREQVERIRALLSRLDAGGTP